MTNQPEAALALINESPFVRTLIVQDSTAIEESKKTTWGSMYGSPRTITTPINLLPKLEPTPTTDASNELGLSHTTFTIRCFSPNREYNHLQAVKSGPLHGPWPDNGGRETFISAALRRTVPSGPMAPAFRDWVTGHQLSRDPTDPIDEAGEGALSIILGRSRTQIYKRERTKARLRDQQIPVIMKSLAAFAAKCNDEPDPHKDQQSQASPPKAEGVPDNMPFGQTTSGSDQISMEKPDDPTKTDTSEGYFSSPSLQKTEKLLDDTTFKNLMEGPDNKTTKKRSKSSAT